MTNTPVRLIEYGTLDSTNAEAERLAAAGERGPVWIFARQQSAGRGRRGRPWVSEPGNLFATLLMELPVGPRVATQASFVASLAIFDVFQALLGGDADLSLKWPNDVLLDERKVAGILIETCGPAVPGQTRLAIGCGLNLANSPDATRYPATALARHGHEVEPERAMAALMQHMANWLGVWRDGRDFASVRRAWVGRAYRLGQEIAVSADCAPVSGTFQGLADDGALILIGRDGRPREFHAGEVSLSWPSDRGAAR